MKTYWQVSVRMSGSISSVITCDETLSGAIQKAITDAIYYKAIYPERQVTIEDLHELCALCGGTGLVPAASHSIRTKRCPECKSKSLPPPISPITLIMPDPANRITLTQVA